MPEVSFYTEYGVVRLRYAPDSPQLDYELLQEIIPDLIHYVFLVLESLGTPTRKGVSICMSTRDMSVWVVV